MFIAKGYRAKTQTEIIEKCLGPSCYYMLYVGTWSKLLLNPRIKLLSQSFLNHERTCIPSEILLDSHTSLHGHDGSAQVTRLPTILG